MVRAANGILKKVLHACLMLLVVTGVHSQISPGPLTTAHAHLEGITNCTQCHVLGEKVSNDKCLECHKEIKSRVDQRKGYHASSEVTGKDCFACHSEHHGRNFEIIRFDENTFNHALTGYKLTGAHQKQECSACHKDEFIASPELRKKKETFLGLRTECIACHKDVHQGTLSKNCASCHNTEAFEPAVLFDHAKTDFPLRGKHKTVDCKSCHAESILNGEPFQRFAGVPFNSCVDCHDDPHNNRLGRDCKGCHTEESFNVFIGKSTFNHSQTAFPLIGKHLRVDCASCHKTGEAVTAANVFQDYKGRDFRNCALCHQDPHESRFGTDCRQCHSEESFQKIKNLDKFNHDLTDFPLEGKHEEVDCKKCHEVKLTEPVAHQLCADCHEDYHRGEFTRDQYRPDCRECHTVEGFAGSSYTVEKHNQTSFPLTGAHLAIPCLDCHMIEDRWTFRLDGTNCNDCHQDIHEGGLTDKYYPQKACTSCHSTGAWYDVAFDHTQTGFPLIGQHLNTSCTSCHQPDTLDSGRRVIHFTGEMNQCMSCHADVHLGQFEDENKITDCTRCHGFVAWLPGQFDHNTARFVLEGAHQEVACIKCHQPVECEGGVMAVMYRSGKLECINCHL